MISFFSGGLNGKGDQVEAGGREVGGGGGAGGADHEGDQPGQGLKQVPNILLPFSDTSAGDFGCSAMLERSLLRRMMNVKKAFWSRRWMKRDPLLKERLSPVK